MRKHSIISKFSLVLIVFLSFCLTVHAQTEGHDECTTHLEIDQDKTNSYFQYKDCRSFGFEPCDLHANYAPDHDFPEHTPIIYIKFVLHVFQREAGTPENFSNTPEDIEMLKKMFHDPEWGMNGLVGNIKKSPSQVPGHPSPYIKDARIRLIFNGIVGEDLFFHQYNTGWAGNDQLHSAFVDNFLENYTHPDIENIKNSIQVTLSSVKPKSVNGTIYYQPNTSGVTDVVRKHINVNSIWHQVRFDLNPDIPTPNYFPPGFSYSSIWWPGAALAPLRGFRIMLEALHNYCIDHPGYVMGTDVHFFGTIPGQNQSWEYYNDWCLDTPFPNAATYEDPGCQSPGVSCQPESVNLMQWRLRDESGNQYSVPDWMRNHLSASQIGRIHSYSRKFYRPYERTSENNFAYPPVTAFCGISQPDIVFPTGYHKVWEGDREVRSNVIIESGASLTIRCTVGFPAGACIIVKPGGHLVIDGARLYSNCTGDYWNGIVVMGNGTNPQMEFEGEYFQGFCEIRPGSIIEDAQIGIQCQHPTTYYSQTGGYVHADGAIFRNCKQRFVYIRNFKNVVDGAEVDNNSIFTNCRFQLDSEYHGSFANQFDAAVRLENVKGVKFQGCTFDNQAPTAETPFADDRKTGIFAYNASFHVTDLCTSTSFPCVGGIPSLFKGFNRALLSTNSYYQHPNTVRNSRFENNVVAYEGLKSEGTRITGNQFIIGTELPLAEQPIGSAAQRGVMLHNSSSFTVSQNNFSVYNGTGTINPVGVLIKDCGQLDESVNYNTYNNVQIANLSNGVNRSATGIDAVQTGLQFLCNRMVDSYDYDIAVPEESDAGMLALGIRSWQGNPSSSAGNEFTMPTPSANPELHLYNAQNNLTYHFRNTTLEEPTLFNSTKVGKVSVGYDGCPENGTGGLVGGVLPEAEVTVLWNSVRFGAGNQTETSTVAINTLLSHYLQVGSESSYDTAQILLGARGDMYALFRQVDMSLMRGQLDDATQRLFSLPSQIGNSTFAAVEYNLLLDLKGIQLQAARNGQSDSTLCQQYKSIIEAVAGAGNYYASVQARALLNAHVKPSFGEVILPGDNRILQLLKNESKIRDARLRLYPNPARDHVEVAYRLPAGTTKARLLISDGQGRVVDTVTLSATETVTWLDLTDRFNGTYTITLLANDSKLATETLVLTR